MKIDLVPLYYFLFLFIYSLLNYFSVNTLNITSSTVISESNERRNLAMPTYIGLEGDRKIESQICVLENENSFIFSK